MASTDSVRVAVRIRPPNAREQAAGYQTCTVVSQSNAQISIGNDKSFTYDFVFDRDSSQIDVYNACIQDLVAGVFSGFNATVLAYGQTGSGKTHTMGTAFDAAVVPPEYIGIIPRAVEQIFNGIDKLKQEAKERDDPEPVFNVEVQFIELYNEELIDLLSINRSQNVRINEHPDMGQIVIKGATTVPVANSESILEALRNGALNRTTGSTNMNQQSSRSHAIFSIHIKQEKFDVIEGDDKALTVLSAKLHFVDLAGSERLKRTGATGDRAKEGIFINGGLLALGNVICALTDPKKTHVPYRDSKLTRLLQDSLGGNSRTLMIACVSPNSADVPESINTLTYAARAKSIQNKVRANRDNGLTVIRELKARIAVLENDLNVLRKATPLDASDMARSFEQACKEALAHFKTRLGLALGDKPELDALVTLQEKLISAALHLKNDLENSLYAVEIPSRITDRRARRDTIFDNGPRQRNKRQKRVTTLISADESDFCDENEEPKSKDFNVDDKLAKLQEQLRLATQRAETAEADRQRAEQRAQAAEALAEQLKADGQKKLDQYQKLLADIREELEQKH